MTDTPEDLVAKYAAMALPAESRLPASGQRHADAPIEARPAEFRADPGAAAAAQSDDAPLILSPRSPLISARAFVANRFQRQQKRILHHLNGSFHVWTGTHYREVTPHDLRAEVYSFLVSAHCVAGDGRTAPFHPNRARVGDVLDATGAAVNLPATTRPPCWIGEAPTDLPAEEIISCANGLFHLPTGNLLPQTPEFFTYNALEFAYDSGAKQPGEWLRFLGALWPGDPESIGALQEMFGYALTADTRQQKMFLMMGPKRSGKGTIARVLTTLLGQDSVVGPTLSSLSQNFGLAPLIGKRLAIISDARLSGRADQQVIVERLLAITGEDSLTVDRKHQSAWTGGLSIRFLILSNELPRLTDASGALASRFILLSLTRSFYGAEDHSLTDRLMGELPGILNWAIAGWRRLTARGYFVQPASAKESVQELEDLASPIGAFLREHCVVEPGKRVDVHRLFDAWKRWCEAQGRDQPGTLQWFGRDLRSAIPGLTVKHPTGTDGLRHRVYEGVGLK